MIGEPGLPQKRQSNQVHEKQSGPLAILTGKCYGRASAACTAAW